MIDVWYVCYRWVGFRGQAGLQRARRRWMAAAVAGLVTEGSRVRVSAMASWLRVVSPRRWAAAMRWALKRQRVLGGAEAVEEVAEGGGGGEGDGAGGVVLGDGFVEAFGKGVEAVVDVLVPFGESQHFDVSRLDLVGHGEQLVGYVHGHASAVAPLLRYEYAFKSLEGASYYAYIVAFLKVDFPG